jgi:hypothetical protein
MFLGQIGDLPMPNGLPRQKTAVLAEPDHTPVIAIFRQPDRSLPRLAIDAARSPRQAAAAAAAAAANANSATPHHSASRNAASSHGTSRCRTSGYPTAAAAAAAAGSGEYDVVLKDSVGFLVEHVERGEADVGDFLLTERDFARGCCIA